MAKRGKKKQKKGATGTKPKDTAFSHNPFKGLSPDTDRSKAESRPKALRREPEPEPEPEENSDELLYKNAMADVTPIERGVELAEQPARPRPMLIEADEEALVMRQLDELVHGETPFDFADTDEYIEAQVAGLDRRLVRKLKRGEYSIQAHLDLHSLNRDRARSKVADFIHSCHRNGMRCILIIHGRGIGSKDNIPVLKNKLAAWLTRGAIGRKVLAFSSARPYDGGTGAIYVLLRSYAEKGNKR